MRERESLTSMVLPFFVKGLHDRVEIHGLMNFPGGELAFVRKALLADSWEVIRVDRDAGFG